MRSLSALMQHVLNRTISKKELALTTGNFLQSQYEAAQNISAALISFSEAAHDTESVDEAIAGLSTEMQAILNDYKAQSVITSEGVIVTGQSILDGLFSSAQSNTDPSEVNIPYVNDASTSTRLDKILTDYGDAIDTLNMYKAAFLTATSKISDKVTNFISRVSNLMSSSGAAVSTAYTDIIALFDSLESASTTDTITALGAYISAGGATLTATTSSTVTFVNNTTHNQYSTPFGAFLGNINIPTVDILGFASSVVERVVSAVWNGIPALFRMAWEGTLNAKSYLSSIAVGDFLITGGNGNFNAISTPFQQMTVHVNDTDTTSLAGMIGSIFAGEPWNEVGTSNAMWLYSGLNFNFEDPHTIAAFEAAFQSGVPITVDVGPCYCQLWRDKDIMTDYHCIIYLKYNDDLPMKWTTATTFNDIYDWLWDGTGSVSSDFYSKKDLDWLHVVSSVQRLCLLGGIMSNWSSWCNDTWVEEHGADTLASHYSDEAGNTFGYLLDNGNSIHTPVVSCGKCYDRYFINDVGVAIGLSEWYQSLVGETTATWLLGQYYWQQNQYSGYYTTGSYGGPITTFSYNYQNDKCIKTCGYSAVNLMICGGSIRVFDFGMQQEGLVTYRLYNMATWLIFGLCACTVSSSAAYTQYGWWNCRLFVPFIKATLGDNYSYKIAGDQDLVHQGAVLTIGIAAVAIAALIAVATVKVWPVAVRWVRSALAAKNAAERNLGNAIAAGSPQVEISNLYTKYRRLLWNARISSWLLGGATVSGLTAGISSLTDTSANSPTIMDIARLINKTYPN